MKKNILKIILTIVLVVIAFQTGLLCGVKYKEYQYCSTIDTIMEWNENNDLTSLIGKKADIVTCGISNKKIVIYVYPTPYTEVQEVIADRLFDGNFNHNKITFSSISEGEYRRIKKLDQ